MDGEWITVLYQKGTRVTIGVKEDMLVFEEMKNWRHAEDTVWTEVNPPKLSDTPLPQRAVTGFTDLQDEWKSCAAPLSGCLIRDTYADETVYQGLVTTAPAVEATEILNDHGKRWTLEKVYMTPTRYWRFDNLAPCRPGVAYAQVHFALVAFTLLGFYLQETEEAEDIETWNQGPLPSRCRSATSLSMQDPTLLCSEPVNCSRLSCPTSMPGRQTRPSSSWPFDTARVAQIGAPETPQEENVLTHE